MNLFCVVDTLGGGRIVGIFASPEVAARVLAIEPSYYQLHACTLDDVNPEAVEWARTTDQRAQLTEVMTRLRPGSG